MFRALSERALADWQRLANTRFYEQLAQQGRLIGTRRVPQRDHLPDLDPRWAAVLEHRRLPVVSYPYEWSFGMLKDAALLQLDLTLAALDEGMTLKDATPFNVQWIGSHPTFIDVGSFTGYEPGAPWAGYRQFCETFLYPLFLQAYRNVPFHPWLRGRLDGMSAEECRSFLSARDYLRPGVLTHVYLQAKAQARYEDSDVDVTEELHAAGFGAALIKNNVSRLRRTVEGLRWTPTHSTWSDYQRTHTYDEADLEHKAHFAKQALRDEALVPGLGRRVQYGQLLPAGRRACRLRPGPRRRPCRHRAPLPGAAPGRAREHPAARGRRCRSVARPGLARSGTPAARRPRGGRICCCASRWCTMWSSEETFR